MESKKNLTRRDFLKLTTVVSTGALVAACAPAAPAPAAPAAPAAKAEPTKAAAAAAPTAAPAAKAPINVRLWVAWGNMNKLFQNEVWYKMPEYQEMVGGDIKIEYKGNTGEARHHRHRRRRPTRGRVEHQLRSARHQERLPRHPTPRRRQQIHQGSRLHPGHLGLLQVLDLRGSAGCPVLRELPGLWPELQQGHGEGGRLRPEQAAHDLQRGVRLAQGTPSRDAAGNLKQFGLDPYDAMGGDPDGMQRPPPSSGGTTRPASLRQRPELVEYFTPPSRSSI